MTKENLKKEVKNWLKKQGYPLEMFVSKKFVGADFYTQEGLYYEDKEENKKREIDVASSLSFKINHVRVNFVFIVECKSGAKPWVMFAKENETPKNTLLYILDGTHIAHEFFSLLSATNKTSSLFNIPDKKIGYRVAQALKDKNIDAGFQSTLKLTKISKAFAEKTNESAKHACNIYFPILVVDTPLYECYLDIKEDIVLNEIKVGRILSRSQDNNYSYTHIDVVTKNYLHKYIENKKQECELVVTELKTELEETVEKNPENITKNSIENIPF